MNDLTRREVRALIFIERTLAIHGYSPTVREIMEAIGHASPSSTHSTLWNLERKGFIRWQPNRPRTIRVLRRVTGYGGAA